MHNELEKYRVMQKMTAFIFKFLKNNKSK